MLALPVTHNLQRSALPGSLHPLPGRWLQTLKTGVSALLSCPWGRGPSSGICSANSLKIGFPPCCPPAGVCLYPCRRTCVL